MSNNYDANERKSAMNRAALLVADMALNGATQEELERAILYSADIIRAKKDGTDWKQSYEDYVIADLEDKYQGADLSKYDKDYLVIDENYRSPRGDVGRGLMIAGFDTEEEAQEFVKDMSKYIGGPNLVILGPKQKN